MSLARDMAKVGQNATAVIEEDVLRNLETGAAFLAKVEPLGDLSLMTDLGIDPRSSHRIHVRKSLGIKLNAGERVQLFDKTLQILPKNAPDNAVEVHDKYFAMQLSEKDS